MVYLAVAGPVARKPNETSDRLYCNGLPAKWLQRHNLHTFFLYSLKVGACLWGLDLWPALTLREVYDYLPQKSNTPILGPTWPECTPPTRRARISDWWRGRNVLFKARELLQDSLTRAVNKIKRTKLLGHRVRALAVITAPAPSRLQCVLVNPVRFAGDWPRRWCRIRDECGGPSFPPTPAPVVVGCERKYCTTKRRPTIDRRVSYLPYTGC